jgi:hypothetical protein
MKACRPNGVIIPLVMAAAFFMSSCTFDTSGIDFDDPIDPRFEGCWQNSGLDEIWGKVIFDIQSNRANLLTGFLFVRAESIATVIPYSLEGEVQGEGISVLQATLHAAPDSSVVVVALLSPPPENTMTFQMAGKPPPPPLSACE